ncbi:hypothetical protein MCGE09_00582 [Thaumarchaeota archaeon SCGC AB-539-E09]|nr:hypothetical protein MCGE09_00582 [Thaumarchaeota archaeon SCGC AB-539-E09]
MTAITLPLKKFPGQMGGQNVSLGGLWIAQPLMLIIATPIACYSVLESPQNPLIVIMVLLPFIWPGFLNWPIS